MALTFFFFGRWYKQDNAFQGVHNQDLMEPVDVGQFSGPPPCPLMPDNGHTLGHYPLQHPHTRTLELARY